MIDDLSKRLQELDFKSNHSIKSKCLKWIVKKYCQITKNKKTLNQKKTRQKTGKELGTTYCLGCKNYTHNFKQQEVKMKIKYLKKNQTVLSVDLVNQEF